MDFVYSTRPLLILFLNLIFTPILFHAQSVSINKKKSIEISPSIQWHDYPSFVVPFNSVINSTIKMQGTNLGVIANYRYALNKQLFIKVGMGYYKYAFDHIQQENQLFGRGNARLINYDDGFSRFQYACDRYWYNTIPVNIGLQKSWSLKNNIDIISGLDVVNYITFSQRYNVGTGKIYKRADLLYFGFSSNLNTEFRKNINKTGIGFNIILPVFNYWKQDIVIRGDDNSSRSKWFKGIGLGITCAYYLSN